MAPRLSAAIAVGAVACVALVSCGEQARDARLARPAEYIASVEELLDPPVELAAALSARARDPDAGAPGRRRVGELLRSARERLDRLRALRIADAGLRRQRDRLARAYARLLPRMDAAARALADGDAAAMRSAAPAFYDSLRSLPSSVAGSSSSR